VQCDARIEHRVWLTAVDLDVMSKIDERLGEVSRVDTLTTNVRFSAVREVGEA
jgi:hypothetical protein